MWDILTDYQTAHASILPTRAFLNYRVEAGGHGDGTVMRFDFRMAGTTRHFYQRVSVVKPGRVLMERDIESTGQTTFTLTPLADGQRTQLDIQTEVPTRSGLLGNIEAWMGKLLDPQMQRVYHEELDNLDRLAQARQPNHATTSA